MSPLAKVWPSKPHEILILACGGTITMVDRRDSNDKMVRVPADNIMEILENVPTLGDMARCTFVKLFNKDSTNMNPSDWTVIARTIAEAAMSNKYDGIIVTHGTDTMIYSAVAVALVITPGLKIPVVFTGSQKPLLMPGSDGRENLERSMQTVISAKANGFAEVMLVFAHRILRATRALKLNEKAFDAFGSPAFPVLGEHHGDGITWGVLARRVPKKARPIDLTKILFSKGVLVIDLVPGLEPGIITEVLRAGKVRALILRSQGAGNVPTDGEYSMIPVIKEATKWGIPVLISTKFVGGTTMAELYATGAAAIEAGAIPTSDLTDVATQVKTMWLLALGFTTGEKLKRELLKPIAGEVSNPIKKKPR